jgi:hypothetical protein
MSIGTNGGSEARRFEHPPTCPNPQSSGARRPVGRGTSLVTNRCASPLYLAAPMFGRQPPLFGRRGGSCGLPAFPLTQSTRKECSKARHHIFSVSELGPVAVARQPQHTLCIDALTKRCHNSFALTRADCARGIDVPGQVDAGRCLVRALASRPGRCRESELELGGRNAKGRVYADGIIHNFLRRSSVTVTGRSQVPLWQT